jgi:putative phage-type endonuclease
MKIVNLMQNTEAWLAYRKNNRIGASDAPIIMQESKWCSPLELWERKLGIAPEQAENSSMARGKALEEEARREFMHFTQITVTPEVVEHETLNWCIASLDGLSVCEKYAVEIKVPGREAHLSALAGVVPAYYIPQLQHQLAVTGLNMIYYYSYDGQNNACIEVQRDDAYIAKLIEAEKKFYKCMVTCTPPELSERDYNIRTDEPCKLVVENWKDAKTHLDFWTNEEKKYRQEMIAVSPSQSWKGFGVKVQKIMRQGAVQYSEIECLKEVDLDKYRKPASESWRITLDDYNIA